MLICLDTTILCEYVKGCKRIRWEREGGRRENEEKRREERREEREEESDGRKIRKRGMK